MEREKEKKHRQLKRPRIRDEYEDERGARRPPSNRGSPRRTAERTREEKYRLHPRLDEWRRQRDYRRGDGRRGEGGNRQDEYPSRRTENEERKRVEQRGRERDEEERIYRYSLSPRPTKNEEREGFRRREVRERDRERIELSRERAGFKQDQPEYRRRKRKRSREEQLADREQDKRKEKDESSESDDASGGVKSSPPDEINELIKDLDELSESQERKGAGSSSEEEGSDGRKHERVGEERVREHVTDSERSEGEIVDRNSFSEEEGMGQEKGETESEREGVSHHSLSRSATEPVLRSKFDSSGSSSEEETQHVAKHKRDVSLVRKGYSGYTEAVSESDHSDVETDTHTPVGAEVRLEERANLEDDSIEENREREQREEEEEEEGEEEESTLPPYLPALMGCRNVEEYEWLNRIEEGTYGVVYRAKDKKTGENNNSTLF